MSYPTDRIAEEIKKFPGVWYLLTGMLVFYAFSCWADVHDDLELGYEAAMKGNFELAIKYYTNAIQSGALGTSDLSVAFSNRGSVWHRIGEPDQALHDYDMAIHLSSKRPLTYYGRGIIWLEKKEYDRAIADFTDCIKLAPNDKAFYLRAKAWLAKKDFGCTIEDLSSAIRINSKQVSAYNDLAWLLATCPDDRYRNGHRALELARKAVELDGTKNPYLLDTLAAALAQVGRFDEAIKTEETAIQILNKSGKETLRDYYRRLSLYRKSMPFVSQ